MTEKNTRVIAILSLKNGVCESFGEGTYIGDLIPDVEPFVSSNRKNPCIKLDNENFVWGFECWWGEINQFNDIYNKHIKETILINEYNYTKPLEGQL